MKFVIILALLVAISNC